MVDRAAPGPARCWTCGYPGPAGTGRCPECGTTVGQGWRSWSQAMGIDPPDPAAARSLVRRVRWVCVAILAAVVIMVASSLHLPRLLLPGWVADSPVFQAWIDASRLVASEVAVPLAVVCLPWALLRRWWLRSCVLATLVVGTAHAAVVVWMDWNAGQLLPPAIALAREALGDVGLVATAILVPALELALLAAAALSLGIGMAWPRRAWAAVGATFVAAVLQAAWATVFVAANTDGLGAWQPTLASMLQVMHWSSVSSTLAMLLASAMLVGLSRAIERRLG